jgi:hypothetical protein
MFGKIHGLENIALCDLEDIKACRGDPVKLQALVNKVHDAPRQLPPASFEEALSKLYKDLE